VDGFAKQYGVRTLVYFEAHAGMHEAIQREKRVKKWNRAWKIGLIEEMNPEWKDVSKQVFSFSRLGPRLRGDDFFRPSQAVE
jgi:putative endonuclease